MAVTGTLNRDYEVLTRAGGLIDRSQRGKLALTGAGSKQFLHGQVTQDIESLSAGHGSYAAFLTQKGKMLGDLRVLDTGEELLLDTERVALQELFNMIRRYALGHDTTLHKRTLERSLLSLIGPAAQDLVGTDPGPAEHDNTVVQIAGVDAVCVRTDGGVDLIFDSGSRDLVYAELLARGAVEVDAEAVDCLRIESGRPVYGIDLDDTVIPQEAGLNDRAVSFTKGCYVGQETVARLFYKGKPNRHLRGLRAAQPLAVGATVTATVDAAVKDLGKITSAANSPRHGNIALALIRREAPVGSEVVVDGAPATVVELPFT